MRGQPSPDGAEVSGQHRSRVDPGSAAIVDLNALSALVNRSSTAAAASRLYRHHSSAYLNRTSRMWVDNPYARGEGQNHHVHALHRNTVTSGKMTEKLFVKLCFLIKRRHLAE